MIKLSWWEEFIIGAGISFLTVLGSKITNTSEQAALQVAVSFLQKLVGGQVSIT